MATVSVLGLAPPAPVTVMVTSAGLIPVPVRYVLAIDVISPPFGLGNVCTIPALAPSRLALVMTSRLYMIMPNSMVPKMIVNSTGSKSANSAATAPPLVSHAEVIHARLRYFVCTPLDTMDFSNAASGFSNDFR